MGHQRLGRLPAHRLLPEIVRFLVTGGTPTEDLVDQVTEIGRDALKLVLNDPVFIEALWLLIRIPQAASAKDFAVELRQLGVADVAPRSFTEMLVGYDNALERVQRRLHAGATDLGEMARHAGLAAFGDALRDRLPTLWTPTADDVKASISTLSGTDRFASIAHCFYTNFVERIIHYYVDRNLHHMVGIDRVARSIDDLRTFNAAIRRHCDESALIMRAFARDWLGKTHYKDGKQITREEVRRFSGHAVEKIRIELDLRKQAP